MTLSRLGESRHFIQSLSSRCLPGCWTSTAAAWRHSDEPSRSVLFRSVVDVLIHRLLSVSWRRLWLRRLRSRLSVWLPVQRRWPWRKLWCSGTRLSSRVCSRLSRRSFRSGNRDGIRRPGSNLLRPRLLSPVRLDCCSDPSKPDPRSSCNITRRDALLPGRNTETLSRVFGVFCVVRREKLAFNAITDRSAAGG